MKTAFASIQRFREYPYATLASVVDGEILLGDSFEVLLQMAYDNSSVTVYGITRDEAGARMEEREALTLCLDYWGDGVTVGPRIGHDIQSLKGVCERYCGTTLRSRSLDTMDLMLRLDDAGLRQALRDIRGETK